MCGYIGVGFGGIIVGGIGIGSNVSGVITGGGMTTGGAGGGGVGYVFDPESKQHNNPNNPNNPNSPGHHFQQSLDSLYLSITIGAGAGVTGRSITITLVFGAF